MKQVWRNISIENQTHFFLIEKLKKIEKKKKKKTSAKINFAKLPNDPGLNHQFSSYDPNIQDKVWSAYMQKGYCQPRKHDFLVKQMGKNQDGSTQFGLMNFLVSWNIV